ncbi:MAG: hypothetical protein VXZ05_08510 [Pseudomonadota bacterium]|nr:hypothetical protein [Pseudomonas sp.]MEC8444236.1 hypothetical protein [Pseudomonadota bacterium]
MTYSAWGLALLFFTLSVQAADYSGRDRWYLGVDAERGVGDENLVANQSLNARYVRAKLGGVGAQGIRFEFSWSRFVDPEADWRISGFDGDLWLPYQVGRPHPRVRPYLLLGMGYHRYYGRESAFLETNRADNGAQGLNAGLAIVANLDRYTELTTTFRYRYLQWNVANDDSIPAADASLTSVAVGIQRLF